MRQCIMFVGCRPYSPLPRNAWGENDLIMPVMKGNPGEGETTICTSLTVAFKNDSEQSETLLQLKRRPAS